MTMVAVQTNSRRTLRWFEFVDTHTQLVVAAVGTCTVVVEAVASFVEVVTHTLVEMTASELLTHAFQPCRWSKSPRPTVPAPFRT